MFIYFIIYLKSKVPKIPIIILLLHIYFIEIPHRSTVPGSQYSFLTILENITAFMCLKNVVVFF